MNTLQTEALKALTQTRKDLVVEAKDGKIAVLKNKFSLTNRAEFQNADPLRVLAFIWSVSNNTRTIIKEDRNCRIVAHCTRSKDGLAQFNLEVESIDPNNHLKYIENMMPVEGSIAKRSTRYPYAVKDVIDSRWFNEMRSMFFNFNQACIHA